MTKEQVLERLQNGASENGSLEKWLLGNGEKRLAEYTCVGRLINFKVQDIIRSNAREDVEAALLDLHATLIAGLELHRDHQVQTLSELYAVAIDNLKKLDVFVSEYYREKV